MKRIQINFNFGLVGIQSRYVSKIIKKKIRDWKLATDAIKGAFHMPAFSRIRSSKKKNPIRIKPRNELRSHTHLLYIIPPIKFHQHFVNPDCKQPTVIQKQDSHHRFSFEQEFHCSSLKHHLRTIRWLSFSYSYPYFMYVYSMWCRVTAHHQDRYHFSWPRPILYQNLYHCWAMPANR